MQPRVESPRTHRRSPLAVWAAAAGVAGALLTVAPRTAEAALANITEWTIPTAGSGPHYITTGPDGALWFTERLVDKIGRITTAGDITEYGTGITAGSNPVGIVAGPDGALWFTEYTSGKIGRITTGGVVTNEYPAGASNLWEITAGPDDRLGSRKPRPASARSRPAARTLLSGPTPTQRRE